MGSGGGGSAPGPSAQELEQTNLQNQLLQGQIADQAKQRADDAYKQTPVYLNQQLSTTRTKQMQDYNTGKAGAYQKARQNILDEFTAYGDVNAAQPYLTQLDQQYNQLGYHSGGDYGTATSQAPGKVGVTRDNYNEDAFLASNPDVAQAIAAAPKGDSSYYQSGRDFLDRTNGWGQRQIDGTVTNSSVTAPAQDTWDDYNALLNNDYGAGQFIGQQRQGRKDQAYSTSKGYLDNLINGLGLDDGTRGEVAGVANNLFQSAYNTAGSSANDYSNVFDPQAVLDSATGRVTTARRGQYSTQVNSLFSGVDPNKDFGDDADDGYINDIVGKQYTDASSALDRAKKRGSLTDLGYNSGMSYLGDQNKTALSSAQSLGGAVLQKDRDALSGIKGNALSGASGYTLGSTFDPNDFLNQYSGKKSTLSGQLGGDITNALAGQNWFDVGDALTKAGYAQGAQNTAALTDGFATPALAALGQQRDKDKDAQRGLGGASTF